MSDWNTRTEQLSAALRGAAADVGEQLPNLAEAFEQLFDALEDVFTALSGTRSSAESREAFEARMLERLEAFVCIAEPLEGSFEWAMRRMVNHNARVTNPALPGVYQIDRATGNPMTASGPYLALNPFVDGHKIPAYGWVEVPK
jgi:hypothetical protein